MTRVSFFTEAAPTRVSSSLNCPQYLPQSQTSTRTQCVLIEQVVNLPLFFSSLSVFQQFPLHHTSGPSLPAIVYHQPRKKRRHQSEDGAHEAVYPINSRSCVSTEECCLASKLNSKPDTEIIHMIQHPRRNQLPNL